MEVQDDIIPTSTPLVDYIPLALPLPDGAAQIPVSHDEELDRVLEVLHVDDEEDLEQGERSPGSKQRALGGHYNAMDDVRVQVGRHFRENPVGQESLVLIAISCVADSNHDVWLDRNALDSIGNLMRFKVRGVKCHGLTRIRSRSN